MDEGNYEIKLGYYTASKRGRKKSTQLSLISLCPLLFDHTFNLDAFYCLLDLCLSIRRLVVVRYPSNGEIVANKSSLIYYFPYLNHLGKLLQDDFNSLATLKCFV